MKTTDDSVEQLMVGAGKMPYAFRVSSASIRFLARSLHAQARCLDARTRHGRGMQITQLSQRLVCSAFKSDVQYASLSSSPAQQDGDDKGTASTLVSNPVPEPEQVKKDDGASVSAEPGAIGGFMRGLIGGRDVAAEDSFIAEAKEQGIDIPVPPPHHRADLVPIKRRKKKVEDEETFGEQSIRDRLFSRFAGSAFMRSALDAKDRIAEKIDESDNPVISLFRNLYDRLFAENEMAMVVREIREDDPSFTVSEFLRESEEKIIPEVLSAYLAGNREKLTELCSEDAYRMLNASIKEREAEGIVMDTNILDISDVELTAGRLLEDAPVLIVTFRAQQINCLRDRSGTVIEGAVDDIRSVYYVWAFVREVELEESSPSGGGIGEVDSSNEAKEGNSVDEKEGDSRERPDNTKAPRPWKMMEMVIRGAHSTL